MKKFKLFFLIIFVSLLSISTYAKSHFKFGKVSKEELLMTYCSFDSSASAVVLFDIGKFDAEKISFSRNIRIKILKKEGLYLANQVFDGNNLSGLRAKTFNLVGDKIEPYKLKSENTFTEHVNNGYKRVRITMPNVKVGSVIDIEFFFKGLPNSWNFQREIPVAYCELYLPSSSSINFRKNYMGYIALESLGQDHWLAEDVPPFKEEPYLSSKNNYISKMNIDLMSINYPGYYKEYTNTWESVARRLKESDNFGLLIGPSSYLKEIEEAINLKANTEFDKLKMAYDTIKMIKWNDKLGLEANHTTLRLCLKDKEGSSTEINLILLNLLKRLNIEAYPVIMSTRENGRMPVYFPSINKLNNTIVQAIVDEKTYVLDASEELIPLGMVPKRCLNHSGRLINEEKTESVSLETKEYSKQYNIMKLDIGDDFTIKGTCSESKSSYNAFYYRKWREDFNSDEDFIKDIESDNEGLVINDLKIENLKDIYQPIKAEMEVELSNYIFSIGDEIYLNPLLFYQLKENPFKIEKRLYPVEYAYLMNKTYNISYTLPEGYTVSELPKPQKVSLPENSAVFIFQATQLNNQLIIFCNFKINKNMFLMEEYDYIKQFYDIVVNKQAEPIILKKI